MKRLLLAVVAVVAIGFTASSAQAGGWGGHCHHHCNRNFYRPPVVCAPYGYAPPVVYQPYAYYPPQNTFFYRGRNFSVRYGW